MTHPYHDPGHVKPAPWWAKYVGLFIAAGLLGWYLFTTTRFVPEVRINREYGKCLFALMVEHRAGNYRTDTQITEALGIQITETDSQDFQTYRGVSSDILCKEIYRTLRDELDLQEATP